MRTQKLKPAWRLSGFLMILLFSLMMNSCYYLTQGSVLIRHRLDAKTPERVLDQTLKMELNGEKPVPDSATLQAFFNRVEDIRRYGVEVLGFNASGNYSKYVAVDASYLVAVVNAAPADSLSPYLWRYPFLGPAPYRGFYDVESAKKEAMRLKAEGYDVWIRGVDGFSTLGFSKDPLYSFMIEYSDYALASLIFHEQIHATFWFKKNIQFNEELATALGARAAVEYIAERYGTDSAEYREAAASRHDQQTFAHDMNVLAASMEELYASGASEGGSEEFEQEKTARLEMFRSNFEQSYDDRYFGEGYRKAAELEINNAFLSLYQTYSGRGTTYDQLCENVGSASATLIVSKPVRNFKEETTAFRMG